MTCGVCDPEAFRADENSRTLGYVVGSNPSKVAGDTRRVHFFGAELVLADQPKGHLRVRPGYQLLKQCLRTGDRLVLARLSALGTNPDRARTNLASIEAEGITVLFVDHDLFEESIS